jgi:hypothetical protein
MSKSFLSVRPKLDEHIPYYSTYIDRVPDGDIVDTLTRQTPETIAFLRAIPDAKADYRYAPEKWSIKEIIGHLADGERVFQYRAFRFSRADDTPVPGFDENLYVANAPFSRLRMSDLIDDLEHLRQSTIHMFASMDEEAFTRRGVANEAGVSVRAIAYIMAGHETHHIQVMKERYLNS